MFKKLRQRIKNWRNSTRVPNSQLLLNNEYLTLLLKAQELNFLNKEEDYLKILSSIVAQYSGNIHLQQEFVDFIKTGKFLLDIIESDKGGYTLVLMPREGEE